MLIDRSTPFFLSEGAYKLPTHPLPIFILIFLSLLLVFILSNIPGTLIRLSSRNGEFSKGWLLRRSSGAQTGLITRTRTGKGRLEGLVNHSRGLCSDLIDILRVSLPGGRYTVGQLVVVLGYSGIIIPAIVLSHPLTHAPTMGEIATYQVPIAVLFAVKMTPLSPLLGMAYTKLNFFHRFIGRMIWVASTVHGGCFLQNWIKAGTVSSSSKVPFITAGIAAWSALTLMTITSMPFIRRRLYGFFMISHWLGFATAMIALGYHQPRSAFYAIIALSIFILDRLLRLFKLNYVQAHLTPFPASSSIMITIPTLRSGWRAGQHVFLTIPSLRTSGGMNWVESHPFTIASASDGQEGVVLIVKKAGDWTRGLYDFAQAGEGSMGGNALEEGKEGMQMIAYNAGGQNGPSPGRACRIIVDGPYGGPGPVLHTSCSSVLLVAGGSGITYALGVLEDIMLKSTRCQSRTLSMSLIWVVKSYDAAQPLLHHLKHLLAASQNLPVTLEVEIYMTRSNTPFSQNTAEQGIIRAYRRPDLRDVFRGVIDKATNQVEFGVQGSGCGVFVGVCGPSGLRDGVKKAVRGVSWSDKRAVGGVKVHMESFGW